MEQNAIMTPFFLVCFLDARQFETLQKITNQIKQIKASAGDRNVLFLLSVPVQHTKIWAQMLARSFNDGKFVGAHDSEQGTVLGQAVLFFRRDDDKTRLSHVEFIPAPPACGHVAFGKSLTYVELQFS